MLPRGSVPGHKLQKPSKESGIFQSLFGTINFVLFTRRQSPKQRTGGGGGRAWHNASSPLNTLLTALHDYNWKRVNHCF